MATRDLRPYCCCFFWCCCWSWTKSLRPGAPTRLLRGSGHSLLWGMTLSSFLYSRLDKGPNEVVSRSVTGTGKEVHDSTIDQDGRSSLKLLPNNFSSSKFCRFRHFEFVDTGRLRLRRNSYMLCGARRRAGVLQCSNFPHFRILARTMKNRWIDRLVCRDKTF